jgi:hypothetical protein
MPAHKFAETARLLSVAIFLSLSVFGLQASLADPLDNPWHLVTPAGQGSSLNAAAYGNGVYVAVGDNGTVTTSPDQVSWTTQTVVSSTGLSEPSLKAVTFGGGLFVAVGTYIWTSPDGVKWTYSACPVGPFYTVAYGNGRYVAAGGLGEA